MSNEQTQSATNVATKPSILKNKWVRSAGVVAAALVLASAGLYWQMSSTEVGIDTSLVSAPTISLSPSAAGQLQEVYVSEGDAVAANAPVARVGTQIIKTQVAGIITSVQNNIGASYNPGQAVVTMVDPTLLRVVGTIDENKGLSRVQVGQPATFTVDAFGSKQYQGIVDEISPQANQQSVIFNISDQRVAQKFNVKVRFNPVQYPELKNGMSAKLTIYTR